MAEETKIDQSEIELLLAQAQEARPAAPARSGRPPASEPTAATATASTATGNAPRGSVGSDVELLLTHAEQALASVQEPVVSELKNLTAFSWRDLAGTPATAELATLDLLRDVELDLKIELGRTHMHLADVLKLRRGSVVTLDKLAGDPVDILVNGRLVARGEVLVLNENFCVRVAELVAGERAE